MSKYTVEFYDRTKETIEAASYTLSGNDQEWTDFLDEELATITRLKSKNILRIDRVDNNN